MTTKPKVLDVRWNSALEIRCEGILYVTSRRGTCFFGERPFLILQTQKAAWAVLLKRVWNVDALKCPKCGGQDESRFASKVISFIEQASVIRRILEHLDLREDPGPPPEPIERVCEPCADYGSF